MNNKAGRAFAERIGKELLDAVEENMPRIVEEVLFGRTDQRIDEQGRVGLPQSTIADLDLSTGDMLYFVKGDSGRWEVHTEAEVNEGMREAWEDKGAPE